MNSVTSSAINPTPAAMNSILAPTRLILRCELIGRGISASIAIAVSTFAGCRREADSCLHRSQAEFQFSCEIGGCTQPCCWLRGILRKGIADRRRSSVL